MRCKIHDYPLNSKGNCRKCQRKKHREENNHLYKEKAKTYYHNNKEKMQKVIYNWREENKQKYIDITDKAREKYNRTTRKEKYWLRGGRERNIEYCRENRHRYNFLAAKRKAALLKAMPKWLSREQVEEIWNIYKHRPHGHHVDHIIPLQSDLVCGLHVPWNLQYLLERENMAKGSKLIN